VVAFCQRFVVMPKGTAARNRIKVRPWQRERIVKEHKKSPRRIDLAMAAIMGFDRAKELVGKTLRCW
jgi:phage terminase large subunit-like protein